MVRSNTSMRSRWSGRSEHWPDSGIVKPTSLRKTSTRSKT